MRNSSTVLALATVVVALAACSTAPLQTQFVIQNPNDLLFDEYFLYEGESLPLVEQPNLFELPSNYRPALDRIIADSDSEYERYRKMRSWIYRHFQGYDFDVTETYSLAQLNTNRKINCLSFSVMFVAAARYVDVPANFQLVLAPPYWDREDNNWINNQHINVSGTIELEDAPTPESFQGADWLRGGSYTRLIRGPVYMPESKTSRRYTADINPAVLNVGAARKKIDDRQVLSLYFSNKAIEALLDRDISGAYANIKEALAADPDSSIAWNNLGVLYSKVGQQDKSIAAYERAIALDENMYSAKSNLASSFRSAGMNLQAAFIESEIEAFRNQNPYYHSALAEDSIAEGDFDNAMSHLEEAVAHKSNEHFFYHQIAVVNQQRGDVMSMLENLDRARRYARGAEKTRFAGKLEALEEFYAAQE